MSNVSKARRLLNKLDGTLDAIDQEPIDDDAPLLYEERCIKIYGTPEYVGNDPIKIKHTCRSDLGTIMIMEYSPLYDAIMAVVEDDDGDE